MLGRKGDTMVTILVVDDEPSLRGQLEWAARGERREVVAVETAAQAIQLIERREFDVVVTDLKMETEDAGLDVLKAAKAKDIYTQVIVVTAYGTPQISVEAMRLGAFDYLERNAPGTDALAMVRSKIDLALQFREAKLKR
jgi:DNA-binding NtrC family response regulator